MQFARWCYDNANALEPHGDDVACITVLRTGGRVAAWSLPCVESDVDRRWVRDSMIENARTLPVTKVEDGPT